ncbi:MAG: nucleotidyltransferase family protein [Candidatus Omnitrophota bacterium]
MSTSLTEKQAIFDYFVFTLIAKPSLFVLEDYSELLKSMDWPYFLEKVFREGISGLIFYHVLKTKNCHIFPDDVREQLRYDYENNLGRNLFLSLRTIEFLDYLNKENIRVLLLRGADFIDRIYPDYGIRAMGDVDIIIAEEDFKRAEKIFNTLGYENYKGYRYLFLKDEVYIDVHLDLAGYWRIPSRLHTISIKNEDVWRDAQPINDVRPLIRKLGVYDAILAACVHMQEHSFSRLIWFVDVLFLIKNEGEDFNWPRLWERARQCNLHKSLMFALSYLQARELIIIPEDMLRNFKQVPLNGFESRSLQILRINKREYISGELLFFFSLGTLKEKLKYIKEVLFIKKELFPSVLPNANIWNYICRFFRIVWYGVSKLFAAFKNENKLISR